MPQTTTPPPKLITRASTPSIPAAAPELELPVEREPRVELVDAGTEKAAHLVPVTRDQAAENRHEAARVDAPERTSQGVRRQHELERCDAAAGPDDARELCEGGPGIVHIAEQVGERQVVELALVEGQRLGLAANEPDPPSQPWIGIELRLSAREHLRALVEANDRAPIAPHESGGHHSRACRDVQHPVIRERPDPAHHRAAPARVLAEAEQGPREVVSPRQAREQPLRLLLGESVYRHPHREKICRKGCYARVRHQAPPV